MKKINEKISTAFEKVTPDVLDSVLADCKSPRKGTVIMMQQKKKSLVTRIAAMAAALVLAVAAVLAFQQYKANYTADTTVALDVNPSLEILVNSREKVLDVLARNKEAETVMGTMDFKGSSLEVTVNALVGSMLRNGFLNEITNAILISVESNNPEKGAQLQEKLTKEVNAVLQTDTFDAAVLSQYVPIDSTLKEQAQTYGISDGKAQLINQIANVNNNYKTEDLAALSITELHLLADSKVELDKTTVTGNPSEKAYIGRDAVKTLTENALGNPGEIFYDEIEMDYEHGRMMYEVECYVQGREYEFAWDAVTGELIYRAGDTPVSSAPYTESTPSDAIKSEHVYTIIAVPAAKATVLEHAGVTEDQIEDFRCKAGKDDGHTVYDIEFYANGYAYDYEVDTQTGKILDYDREKENRTPQAQAQAAISEDTAKATAYAHAGVTAAEILRSQCKLERDDGRTVYEIEFDTANAEYEYEIDAETGSVLKAEKERPDYDD